MSEITGNDTCRQRLDSGKMWAGIQGNSRRKRVKSVPVTIQAAEVENIWTISLTGPAT